MDAGADDYVTSLSARPSSEARARALPAGSGASGSSSIAIGALVLDPAAHTPLPRRQPLHLTRTEWELLRVLMSTPAGCSRTSTCPSSLDRARVR